MHGSGYDALINILQAFNNTWDCRVHTAGRTSYLPQFPFFLEVSTQICRMVETSMAEILQENENSIIGMTYIMDCIAQNVMRFYQVFLQQILFVAVQEIFTCQNF